MTRNQALELYLQSSCLLHPAKLEACLGATLHHALLSMLVTSATTAAAFLASLASSVTAIKCFRSVVELPTKAREVFTVNRAPTRFLKPPVGNLGNDL